MSSRRNVRFGSTGPAGNRWERQDAGAWGRVGGVFQDQRVTLAFDFDLGAGRGLHELGWHNELARIC
jgi:hypothetical protein